VRDGKRPSGLPTAGLSSPQASLAKRKNRGARAALQRSAHHHKGTDCAKVKRRFIDDGMAVMDKSTNNSIALI
jgi:hypothetical protein